MKKLFKSLVSIRKNLLIVLCIALGVLILINFVWSDTIGTFKGGAKLGVIISGLCLAYISSFIFYVLVIQLKYQQDKDSIYPYITKETGKIIGDAKQLITFFKSKLKFELQSEYPSKVELTKICKEINVNSKLPPAVDISGKVHPFIFGLDKKPMTEWFQFFEFSITRAETAIKKIYTQIRYLDSTYIKLLMDLENCPYFYSAPYLISTNQASNLTLFIELLHNYFGLVEKLEEYYNKCLKAYEEGVKIYSFNKEN